MLPTGQVMLEVSMSLDLVETPGGTIYIERIRGSTADYMVKKKNEKHSDSVCEPYIFTMLEQ